MRVSQLWRYPVKSVGGQRLRSGEIVLSGVLGDRTLAVRDTLTGEITWAGAVPGLMRVTARTLGDGTNDAVELHLPDGSRVRSDQPDADSLLSEAMGHLVTLVRHRPTDDTTALHLVTTAGLRSLSEALPQAQIEVARFRPNLVLDVDAPGHPDHGWLGRRLQIGTVTLRFTTACKRCVVVTKATPRAAASRAVLRWVARELDNVFGVYAAVESPGIVNEGDDAHWLTS
jgi:uncharacterized protein YcbX